MNHNPINLKSRWKFKMITKIRNLKIELHTKHQMWIHKDTSQMTTNKIKMKFKKTFIHLQVSKIWINKSKVFNPSNQRRFRNWVGIEAVFNYRRIRKTKVSFSRKSMVWKWFLDTLNSKTQMKVYLKWWTSKKLPRIKKKKKNHLSLKFLRSLYSRYTSHQLKFNKISSPTKPSTWRCQRKCSTESSTKWDLSGRVKTNKH